jgi:hypothetical protein
MPPARPKPPPGQPNFPSLHPYSVAMAYAGNQTRPKRVRVRSRSKNHHVHIHLAYVPIPATLVPANYVARREAPPESTTEPNLETSSAPPYLSRGPHTGTPPNRFEPRKNAEFYFRPRPLSLTKTDHKGARRTDGRRGRNSPSRVSASAATADKVGVGEPRRDATVCAGGARDERVAHRA